ncbi:M56 family metallopeptidase [Pseudaestuariivita atlantica]|uniref:Peptidase M56 domain-containing protein n=1 Tax=Pseudaestuariivita atlantica TaxID=1317121 RepID=A0A0L1JR50_9RHOB|nr:M56 family metallopeptidase [Pseudaestuariivita atlantica]KNG94215.1 hypothetical protein ATO11_08310 [Pseudaestuariivita atlantica]
MQTTKFLIDLYIDANILLAVAWMVWALARLALDHGGLRHNYATQVQFTQGLMLATLASPLVALGFIELGARLVPGQSLTASDLVLAQFLDGRIGMEAVQFQALLEIRPWIVQELAAAQSPLAVSLWAAFGAGFALALARTVWRIGALRRLVAEAFVLRRAPGLDIRISDDTTVPFSTRGLRRRHVVLPATLVADSTAMKIALAHEMQHMRRADVEWEVALELLRPLFFWNPFFGLWKRGLDRLRELSVDQALMRRGRITPRAYANCLLSVCKASLNARGQISPMTARVPFLGISRALAGRRNIRVLRHRITAMSVRPADRAGLVWVWAPIVVTAIVIGAGAATLKKPGDWSQDRLMLSTIVNLERMESRNTSPAGF